MKVKLKLKSSRKIEIMNIKHILRKKATRNIHSYLSLISRVLWRFIKKNTNKKISRNKKRYMSKCCHYKCQQNIEVQNLKLKIITNKNNGKALEDKADLTKMLSNYLEKICLEETVVHCRPKQLLSLEIGKKKSICISSDKISFFFENGKSLKLKVCEDSRLGLEIVYQKVTHLDKNEYESNKEKNDESTLLYDLLQQRCFQIKEHSVFVYMQPSVELWHPVSIDDIPWAWLKEEKWRLHTFAKYPQNSAKSALLLAADGFAYIGIGRGLDDNVICYFCCATKSSWHPSDVISDVHKQLSPQCPMTTGINCDNVPMTCPNGGSALFRKIYGQQRSTNNTSVSSPTPENCNELETDGVSHNKNRRDMASAASQNVNSGIIFADTSFSRPPLSQQAHVEHHDADVTVPHQPSENDAPSSTVTSSHVTAWQPFESNNDIRFQQPVRQSANGNNRPVAPSTRTDSSFAGTPDRTNSSNSRTRSDPSNTNPTDSQPGNQANNPQSQTTSAPSNGVGNQVSGSVTSQNGTKTEGPTYAQLGIITERPKRYDYAVITKRLETFDENWPEDHHLKKEDLAEAGFYYAGYGDCARCFYCGGGLRNWEAEDDVWVEHARWFPKCAFIRQQMGQVFVDTVQELNKNYDQIPFVMVSNKIGKPASVFHLDSRDTPLKRDAAVRTVVEMGFDLKDVIAAAESVKDEASILSADKIYEKLLQENRSRNTNVQNSSKDIGSTENVARNLESLKTLKEQNNQLRQQTVCKICMDKEVAVVFLPCGHLVSCSDCAAAMKDCPVCRNSVKGVVRAFMG